MQQAVESKTELLEILETLDPSQLRLVLSFIKNLFDL